MLDFFVLVIDNVVWSLTTLTFVGLMLVFLRTMFKKKIRTMDRFGSKYEQYEIEGPENWMWTAIIPSGVILFLWILRGMDVQCEPYCDDDNVGGIILIIGPLIFGWFQYKLAIMVANIGAIFK